MFKGLKLWGILAAALFGLGLSSSAHGAAQDSAIVPTQRIITFKAGVSAEERARIVQTLDGKVIHDLHLINAVAVQFPPDKAGPAEAALKSRPDVVRIENDLRFKWIESSVPTLSDVELPSVGSIIQPFKTRRPVRKTAEDYIPWGVKRVNAPAAWSVTRGQTAKVVVIDTGIDYNHPQLKDHIKGGANLVTGAPNPADYMDDHGHGTHVSGTISASINDGVTDPRKVWGVAPRIDLYGVKVLDANGSGTYSDVIAGIQWAADNRMDVASMSLGASQGTDALAEMVQKVVERGVVIVAAAGNSGGAVGYPAAYPQVIAISAIDINDKLASWSSRGPEVAFAAPGVDVPSLYKDSGYATMSGTSMACPHVSGLAALAVSAKHVHGHDPMLNALKAAATKIPDLGDNEQGSGVIDAAKLVQ